MSNMSDIGLPRCFGFLLLNDFTLISFSSAIEPLRMANRICREEIYSWKVISETGEVVRASDGLSVNVDYSFDSENLLDDMDVLMVCGGRRVENNVSKSVSAWLRMLDQNCQ